jgi:ligand-binding SRPBCC domain-containing protein
MRRKSELTMRFSFQHTIPLRNETVFAFFQKPERLALLHEDWSSLRLLQHEPYVRLGGETWVEVMFAGFVPIVLGFRHTILQAPVRFGEETIHGPFSRFTHIHEFEPQVGHTIVRDVLDVRLPWQYGGEAGVRRLVAPEIRRTFHFRAQTLERLATDGALQRCALETMRQIER